MDHHKPIVRKRFVDKSTIRDVNYSKKNLHKGAYSKKPESPQNGDARFSLEFHAQTAFFAFTASKTQTRSTAIRLHRLLLSFFNPEQSIHTRTQADYRGNEWFLVKEEILIIHTYPTIAKYLFNPLIKTPPPKRVLQKMQKNISGTPFITRSAITYLYRGSARVCSTGQKKIYLYEVAQ